MNTPNQTPKKPQDKNSRQQLQKQNALTHKTPSQVRGIQDALVVKADNLYFLCERDGQVPLERDQGFGLYYHDMRFLSGYTLELEGWHPETLVATGEPGFMGTVELINHRVPKDGQHGIESGEIGIQWQRVLNPHHQALHDILTLKNYAMEPVELNLQVRFAADFRDIFSIRGMASDDQRGQVQTPEWRDDVLCMRAQGIDGCQRGAFVHFSERPQTKEEAGAGFRLRLPANGQSELLVTVAIAEREGDLGEETRADALSSLREVRAYIDNTQRQWLGRYLEISSNSPLLERITQRALGDLRMLKSKLDGKRYFAAGVPWFVTLFGRDSLITAMQALPYQPEMARETLRLLARYQGQQEDHWRDEQPGKFLHELRVGELTRSGELPYDPYYGTIDTTLLFLIVLARYVDWTGDLDLFRELRPQVDLALRWMDEYGDLDGDGYIEYASPEHQGGLINQGWKDSGNAIVNADGSLAQPPIALVEVQGYSYLARCRIAALLRHCGEHEAAQGLTDQAEQLKERFDCDYWLPDKDFFALALQGDQPDHKQAAAVISSNPGQALWTGIIAPEKAGRVARQLLSGHMFSGWGVRTLSSLEHRYNPVSYHLGSVWPHDNGIIAAGLRRYGFDEPALQIACGIFDAASRFPGYRLPELFSGFSREEYQIPVRYPVADHPQAWAAGSILHLLETLLGLCPDALNQRLRICRPILPDYVRFLELRGLRLGQARVDLRFERDSQGKVQTQVLRQEGDIQVEQTNDNPDH